MNRAQGCVVISRLKDYLENGSTGVTPSTPDKDDTEDIPSTGASYDTAKYNVPADANKDGILTEEEVQTAILAMKEEYPQGTAWGDDKVYYSAGFGNTGYGCAAFMLMVTDAAFGNLPKRTVSNVDDLRVGDIVYSSRVNHWSIVTGIDGETLSSVSGNVSGKVSWTSTSKIETGREYLNQGYITIYTRYPA